MFGRQNENTDQRRASVWKGALGVLLWFGGSKLG